MKITDSLIANRFFVIPLLLVAALTIVSSTLTYIHYTKIINDRYEEDLLRLAVSGAQLIGYLNEYADTTDFDRFADTFAENGNFRVTIISLNGTVLGDSKLSYDEIITIENHANRPEIISAKESGRGVSRRFSETLKVDLLYVAVRYNKQGMEGIFRVALPLTALQQDISKQRITFAGFCIFALLIALSMIVFMSKYLLQLVKKNRKELEQAASDRTREIELIQNLGTQLTVCNSQQEVLDVICLITSILLPKFCGALFLLNRSKDRLEIATTWNGEWKDGQYYNPNDCWSIRTGKKHVGYQAGGTIPCPHTTIRDCKMMCIPLMAQGETLGVLHFSCASGLEITPEEEKLTNAVAEHASLTLASLNLRESLQLQAMKDPLTGLYNRRFLFATIEHSLSRAERSNTGLGILMLDIDHFKQFNDEYGHDIGDVVLEEFSSILLKELRKEDIACRYGGEEFTVLLTDTSRESACHVAEKISKRIRTHQFVSDKRHCGTVTVSIGVSTYPENSTSTKTLMKLADDALYQAKHKGRDRVVVAKHKIHR